MKLGRRLSKKYLVVKSWYSMIEGMKKIPTIKPAPISPLINLFHKGVSDHTMFPICIVAVAAPKVAPITAKMIDVSWNV